MSGKFRFGPRSKDVEADVHREIEAHLEQRTEEFMREGMGAEEARQAALSAFGDRERIEAEVRGVRGATVRGQRRRLWIADLAQDSRLAVRGLLRTPLFTVVALLTLALGIGANTAVFSVLRSVILRPLPYPDSDRLVQIWTDHRSRGRAEPEWLTPPQLEAYRDQNTTFASVAGIQGWGPSLTGEGAPEMLTGGAVSASFFDVLGIPPALGRGFLPADDAADAERVVVLSDGLWRRRFNADPGVVNRTIELDGELWTVIGVMPPAFRPPLPWEIIRPLRFPVPNPCGHGCITTQAIGRLGPGVTPEQAQGDLQQITERLSAEAPEENQGVGSWIIPLHEQVTGAVRPALVALFGAVFFVLLIACVNLASLMLVRAGGRGREFGVRAALGAGRGRIVRQLLTESLVLASAGGLLGLVLGWIGTRLLTVLIPPGVQSVQQIAPDLVVVLFCVGLTLVAGVLFGIMPALHTARPDLMGFLRVGQSHGSRSIGTLRRGLVVAELALAVVLLVGAGLLLRTFLTLQRTDLGFRTEGLISAGVAFTPAGYPEIAGVTSTMDEWLLRLRAHPSIRAVEVTDLPPLGLNDQDITFLADGVLPANGQRPLGTWFRRVSRGYLPLVGARLVEGRMFGPEDGRDGERVAIITREAARRLWPGENPIGRFGTTGTSPEAVRVRIVGIVEDLRYDGPMEPVKPQVFFAMEQFQARFLTLLFEPASPEGTAAAVQAVRSTLAELDPTIPLAGVATLDDQFADVTQLPRYFAAVVAAFGGAALLLSIIGVYGTMAYTVSQRQREIGVRIALGAEPRGMLTWMMRDGVRLTVLGLLVGLLLAAVSTRLLEASLYGVRRFDPMTFLLMSFVLAASALVACWIPSRRAGSVDPVVALRAE